MTQLGAVKAFGSGEDCSFRVGGGSGFENGVFSVFGLSESVVSDMVSKMNGDQIIAFTDAACRMRQNPIQFGSVPFPVRSSSRVASEVAGEHVSQRSAKTYSMDGSVVLENQSYLQVIKPEFQAMAYAKCGSRISYAALLGLPAGWFIDLEGFSLSRSRDGGLVLSQRGVSMLHCLTAVSIRAVSQLWQFPPGSLGGLLQDRDVDSRLLDRSPGLSDEFGSCPLDEEPDSAEPGFCYRLWASSCPALKNLGPWPTGLDLNRCGVPVGDPSDGYYAHAGLEFSAHPFSVVGAPHGTMPVAVTQPRLGVHASAVERYLNACSGSGVVAGIREAFHSRSLQRSLPPDVGLVLYSLSDTDLAFSEGDGVVVDAVDGWPGYLLSLRCERAPVEQRIISSYLRDVDYRTAVRIQFSLDVGGNDRCASVELNSVPLSSLNCPTVGAILVDLSNAAVGKVQVAQPFK